MSLIDRLVTDVIVSSATRLDDAMLSSPDEARNSDQLLVGYSDEVLRGKRALKEFLRDRFYYHPRVVRMTRRAESILTLLFERHREDMSLLPERVRMGGPQDDPARLVADYIAGMTDRFALATHSNLTEPHEQH